MFKNEYSIQGNAVEVVLNSNKRGKTKTILDKETFDRLNEQLNCSITPYWDSHTQSFYCRVRLKVGDKCKSVQLHRLITDCPDGMQVDHLNNNTLDNRLCNLKIATHSENQFNRSGAQANNKTSGVRGVAWHKRSGKWSASFQKNGERVYLGHFENVNEAKKALDSKRN